MMAAPGMLGETMMTMTWGMIKDGRIAKYNERLKQWLGIHTVWRMAFALIANAWNAGTLSWGMRTRKTLYPPPRLHNEYWH